MKTFNIGDIVEMVDPKGSQIPEGAIGTVLENSHAPWICWDRLIYPDAAPLFAGRFPGCPQGSIACASIFRLRLVEGNQQFAQKHKREEW